MILSHFSEKPFRFNPKQTYISVDSFKPVGLWLSDESDHGWKQWCEGQEWNLKAFKYQTDFTVIDFSNWLALTTKKKVLEFGEEFKHEGRKFSELWGIDWPRVQKQFDGILISPYQWSLRHNRETSWYYGWDCSSACVWNLKTIEVVRER